MSSPETGIAVYVNNNYFGSFPENEDLEALGQEIIAALHETDPQVNHLVLVFTDENENPLAVATLISTELQQSHEEEEEAGFELIEFTSLDELNQVYVYTDPQLFDHLEEHLRSLVQPELIPLAMSAEDWEMIQYQEDEWNHKLEALREEVQDLLAEENHED
jgi:hypothetical protein